MGALENPNGGCGCGTQAGSDGPCGGSLPDSPDCAIHYHYGMLLGVDDFRTEQGFHVGRLRRHQRTLHGWGVVYGYAVRYDAAQTQLRVEAGYALDRLGRDLQLDDAQCLGLPAWWQLHRDDEIFADIADKDDAQFDADILLCYRNCLSRAVPAIADPCSSDSANLAYSRICEAPQLRLVRRSSSAAAADPAIPPYHLLRLLGGLDLPMQDSSGATLADDLWLATQLATLAALPAAQQAAARRQLWQAASARAAANTTDPRPVAAWQPPADGGDGSGESTADCLVLARLSGVHIHKNGDSWQAGIGGIDIDGRQTLLPDHLQQALPMLGSVDTLPLTGPLPLAGSAQLTGNQLQLDFDRALDAGSVQTDAFIVSELDSNQQWQDITLSAAAYDSAQKRVTLQLDHAPAGTPRIGVRGRGAAFIRGSDNTPAGIVAADGQGSDIFIIVPGV